MVLIDGHFPAAARHTLEAQGVQVRVADPLYGTCGEDARNATCARHHPRCGRGWRLDVGRTRPHAHSLNSGRAQVVNIDHEEVTQWQQSSRYPAIANADYPRLAPFVKLIAWKMVQYENIFYFDADTEIRSNLTEYFLTLPKGRDAVISNVTTHRCNSFFNAGVMVVRHSGLGPNPTLAQLAVCLLSAHAAAHSHACSLMHATSLIYLTVGTCTWAWQMRPSQRMYDALMSIWRAGSFRHNLQLAEDDDEGCETQRASAEAKHYPGEQNVLIEYFTGGADRYHVLDPCYNYRGRVSEQESCGQCAGQECDDRVKVLHIAKLLKWMDMSTWQVHSWRGTCRTVPLPIRRRKGVI